MLSRLTMTVTMSPPERIEDTHRRFEGLRQWYTRAYKNCPESMPVWMMAAEMEEQVMNDVPKARAVLDKAKPAQPPEPGAVGGADPPRAPRRGLGPCQHAAAAGV